ncbi:MAG TPA: PASTA domain-containing protein [Solirubrobacterales bacterium]|nr:PASTA domain-containing protein [Solirubrobacterales bacterium]
MRRALAGILAAAWIIAIAPASAIAEEHPPYDGLMTFPAIHGSAEPEEFSWEVQLGEGETLELVDDRNAVLRWEDGTAGLHITAQLAHDAEGTNVPTTLAVTQPNIVTLTVHHRAGNPAAGGASFVYPVVAGAGWEGGFQTHVVAMPPPVSPAAAPDPRCEVPDLSGRPLKASRKLLRRSNCGLGPVRGQRSKAAKVVKQYRRPGKSLPAGTEVGVKLA